MIDQRAIVIIVENLPVPFDRRVWQEACALRDGGYDVTVICPQMRGFVEPEEVLEGIQIYRHPIAEEASGIVGFFKEYLSALWGERGCLKQAWGRKQFDLIHLCNPPDVLFLVALPYFLFKKVRVVYDVHDLWPEMFEAKFGRRGVLYWAVRAAERMTLRMANVVIATNQSVLDAVTTRGKKEAEDVFVVRTSPKAIDLCAEADQSLKKGRSFLVGYIGVMGDADGVHYLLEAANHLVNVLGREDVQFLLMGTGPEWEALEAMRNDFALQDYVDMPGRVSDEFLCSALQSIDLGVGCDPINSYNDHCTMNKTLEYMAFGKPQVIFDIKEGRVSAGDAACYVKENSAEALGASIIEVLDDPDRRARMGAIGAERIRGKLSWEHSVNQLLTSYRHALK